MILMSEDVIYDIDIQKERNIVRAIILFRNTSAFHERKEKVKTGVIWISWMIL